MYWGPPLTRRQSLAFVKTCRGGLSLSELLNYVGKYFKPQYVFDELQLEDWAWKNNFYKMGPKEYKRHLANERKREKQLNPKERTSA